jgi:hypothetical protein
VHHDTRLHVVDPEILAALVAQRGDRTAGQLLRLRTIELAAGLLRMRPDDDAVGDLDVLAGRVLACLQRQLGLVRQLPADQSEQRQRWWTATAMAMPARASACWSN